MRRPVARLVEATREVAAGNLEARVPTGRGSQEVVELAQAFNSMAEALAPQKKSLDEGKAALEKAYSDVAEKNRAYLEMLGFVTHELKSPLASIVFGIGSLREGILGPLNEAQQAALRSSAYSADYLQAPSPTTSASSRLEEGDLGWRWGTWRWRRWWTLLEESTTRRRARMHLSSVAADLVARCDRRSSPRSSGLVSNAIACGGRGGCGSRCPGAGADVTCSVGTRRASPRESERLFGGSPPPHRPQRHPAGHGARLFVSRQSWSGTGAHLGRVGPGHRARFGFASPPPPSGSRPSQDDPAAAPGRRPARTDSIVASIAGFTGSRRTRRPAAGRCPRARRSRSASSR
jgi:hypothetical protein